MQPSHDANGQVVSMNMTGSTMSTGSSSVGSKLHNELSAGAHEGMVSTVTGGTAVGGVSAASVMSVGAPSSFTPSMLSGGDNYSQYQGMFAPDSYMFGMYGYYGNSQGLGDASAGANANSLWSGTATGAANSAQNDLSLSYMNFAPTAAPAGAHSYSDFNYFNYGTTQNPYNAWGAPATAQSGSGLDYGDLSGAASWGNSAAPPDYSGGSAVAPPGGVSTNGSALLKETAGSMHAQQQQQSAALGTSGSALFASTSGYGGGAGQQQANNNNIFVNGGLTSSTSAMMGPMGGHVTAASSADFVAAHNNVPVSSAMLASGGDRCLAGPGAVGAGSGGGGGANDLCGLEQPFSQFGLGHSPSSHATLTTPGGPNLSALMSSPPGGHHVGHQALHHQPPVSGLRSDETHFPGLGGSASVAAVSVTSSQPSIIASSSMSSGGLGGGGGGGGGGKKTWASIASQPAKGSAATLGAIPGPGSRKLAGGGGGASGLGGGLGGASSKAPGRGTPTVLRPNMPWDSAGGASSGGHGGKGLGSARGARSGGGTSSGPLGSLGGSGGGGSTNSGVLFTNEELASKNFNPRNFDLNPKVAKFFVIKSYSEDDIHRSIKYQIWCSTEHGNKKLDAAFHEMEARGPVYLFFSVNGSGHFCGVAQMASRVDYDTRAGVWCQDKWKGEFRVKWIYVKDVPNSQLRHIRLETNENKPVTNSRDATEVPLEKGRLVLKVIHTYKHSTSIFDDFSHYERREEQENQKRTNGSGPGLPGAATTFAH